MDVAEEVAPVTIVRNVRGFRAKASTLELSLGYAIHSNGAIELYVLERIGAMEPTVWRNFLTTREAALDVAEGLCADVEDYLDLVAPRRPYEDLDMDDYLKHLECALTDNFH